MNWESLCVIAVRHPEETGVVISQPVVRDTDGNVFIVRDVTTPDPAPNILIDSQDIEAGRIGPFVSIKERPAQIRFLSVVASPEFNNALKETIASDILRWEALQRGLTFAYASLEDIQRWRKYTIGAFLSKAEENLSTAIRERYKCELELNRTEILDLILTQLGYITDRGTHERRRMYLLQCIFLSIFRSGRWPVVEDLAMRELECDAAQLQNEMHSCLEEIGSHRRLFDPPRPEPYARVSGNNLQFA